MIRRSISAFVVALFLLLVLSGQDVKLQDTSDLQLIPLELSDDENAYLVLQQASQHYGQLEAALPVDVRGLVDSYNKADAEQFLKHYAPALELFEESSKLEHAQIPTDYQDVNSMIPNLEKLRELFYANHIYARWLLQQGDAVASLDKAMVSVRAAQQLSASRATLLANYFAYGSQSRAFESLNELLLDKEFSAEQLSAASAEIVNFDYQTTFLNGLRGEFMMQQASIGVTKNAVVGRFGFLSLLPKAITTRIPYLFLPNKTTNGLADSMRRVIRDIAQCGLSQESQEAIEAFQDAKWYKKNFIGKVLASILLPNFDTAINTYCIADAERKLMAVRLSLEAYKSDQGHYPSELNELVPTYLVALPKDPFSGDMPFYDGTLLSFTEAAKYKKSASLLTHLLN